MVYNTRRVSSARDRMLRRVRAEDRGYESKCFIWTGELDRTGYGRIKHKGRYVPAHWVFLGSVANGYRPPKDETGEEMEVDHLCKQRDCVRPTHLEYVTHIENMRRMHEDRRNQ
jgi:hypothetical protein